MRSIAIACALLMSTAAPALAQRDTTAGFTAGAGTRHYMLHTPPARFGSGRPLVVVLHGCTQDARQVAASTRFSAEADSLGFNVLYPEQSVAVNPYRCWQWFEPAHQGRDGEPALIAAMTRDVARRVGADTTRIFIVGLSAGGAMAVNVLAAHGDLFAGGAAHSAVPYAAATGVLAGLAVMKSGVPGGVASVDALIAAAADRPLRKLLVIHGAKDTVVAAVNGSQLATQWAHAIERRTGAPTPATMVETFIVPGLGHAWSGGFREGSVTDPEGPSATRLILRFFGLSPKPIW